MLIAAAVSFFLVLFLSLKRPVEMWKTPQTDRILATNTQPDQRDDYPETFEPG